MNELEAAEKLIAAIDQRIQKLLVIKEEILHQFGSKNEKLNQPQYQLQPPENGRKKKKQLIVDLLRQTGPLRRSEILERTEMAVGTLAFCLNDKKLFKSLGDGRWDLGQKDSA